MSGVMMTGMEYRCLVCSSSSTRYVLVEHEDGELVVDGDKHATETTECAICEQERIHAADTVLTLREAT